jgi:hypothetical protein
MEHPGDIGRVSKIHDDIVLSSHELEVLAGMELMLLTGRPLLDSGLPAAVPSSARTSTNAALITSGKAVGHEDVVFVRGE